MQSAANCNINNNRSNNTNATTTTTISTTILESNNVTITPAALATHPTPSVVLTPVSVLEQTNEPRNVSHVDGTPPHTNCASVLVNEDIRNHTRIEAVSPHIDLAEYLGSNVECMSVTPSPSPQVSPSKKLVQNKSAHSTSTITKITPKPISLGALNVEAVTASSSSTSSSSSSSSSSSASSVIASPLNVNHNTIGLGRGESGISDKVAGEENALNLANSSMVFGANGNSDERRVVLATKGLPLRKVYEEEKLSFMTPTSPLTPAQSLLSSLSPSSSSSSDSLSACTNSINSSVAPDTPSLNSTSSSSKSSPATLKLPAFDPTLQLQDWQDMPKYLQFNPYVLKGYRPLTTFRGCLQSLFYWHNETINILTHAIPIIYILAIVPGLMPWEQEFRFLSFCHLFGSVAPWCGSFLYHLFMNIEKGEHVYYNLLKLDMLGIWVSQSFGALPLVTATTFCLNPIWKWLIIIVYCLLSLWGLYKALTASSPWQRRLCFALPFTFRSILTFFRTIGVWVGGSRLSLSHVYLQDGVSILGGVIGAMRIPEKWFPGLLDFYLNSHNIMHVLVVVAVYSMHKATIKDIEWMSATNCTQNTSTTTNDIGETIDTIFTSNVEL